MKYGLKIKDSIVIKYAWCIERCLTSDNETKQELILLNLLSESVIVSNWEMRCLPAIILIAYISNPLVSKTLQLFLIINICRGYYETLCMYMY
ncbi:hypothetical protein ES332_A03G198200v1 [Gossypium tomentosum]|uniref:Uncharacterized protein n=1 Tax=Gossypium tomentosum TaxID=34277 RepID=A0A5D2R913_GOSTO|nr:hypothetical protein ES332_A03G198200v1 [Gossypium tomentosum]